MKVKILSQVSGTRNGQPWPARGEILEVSDSEGRSLIASQMAVLVLEQPERAVLSRPEVETRDVASGDSVRRVESGVPSDDGADSPTAKQVREWAAANGVEVPARGRIPESVIKSYNER